jgi:hypothetical protein
MIIILLNKKYIKNHLRDKEFTQINEAIKAKIIRVKEMKILEAFVGVGIGSGIGLGGTITVFLDT